MTSCVRPGNKASGYCHHQEHVLSLTAAVATGLLVQEWTLAHWTARGDNYCTVVQYQPVLMFIWKYLMTFIHVWMTNTKPSSTKLRRNMHNLGTRVHITFGLLEQLYIHFSLQMASIPQAVLATAVNELQRRAILSDRGGLIHISNEQVSRTLGTLRLLPGGSGCTDVSNLLIQSVVSSCHTTLLNHTTLPMIVGDAGNTFRN